MQRRLLCLLAVLVSAAAQAAVAPYPLFSDNCVLQRDMPVPIWGTADPGEAVTVAIAGQSKSAKAGADGTWMVKLDALKAGGPFTLTIGDQQIQNVLVGEVWLCSGQSNMAFTVGGSDTAEDAIAKSENDQIRLLTVPNRTVDEPSHELVNATWKLAGPDSVKAFSATGYYTGRALQRDLKVPVGLINSSVGGTRCEAWATLESLEAHPELQHHVDQRAHDVPLVADAMKKYQDETVPAYNAKVKAARAEGKPLPRRPQPPFKSRPCGLYNGMIAPLAPYAMRGGMWYQGEANTQSAALAYEYRILLPAMIEGWRKVWGQDQFDFYFVQLPAYASPGRDPNSWPLIRESMAIVAETLPHTGMAVALDKGEENNIHPKAKEPVGERMAQAMMVKTYGADMMPGGPLYESMKVEGQSIRLTFKQVDGGLEGHGDLVGFEVAGEDQVYHAATAKIDGDDVVVTSGEVAKPVAARYAWANWPQWSLFSVQGLPASPFRTETWDLVPKE